jgi:hypothetical protein
MRLDNHRYGIYLISLMFLLILSNLIFAQNKPKPLAVISFGDHKKEIFEEDLQRFIRNQYQASSQKTQINVQDALSAYIDLEILSEQAQKAGLNQSNLLKHHLNQLSIYQFLKQDFEEGLTANRLPQKYVDQAYEQNKVHFNHDELRGAVHILFLIHEQSFEQIDPMVKQQVKAKANAFYEMLQRKSSVKMITQDEFKALAQGMQTELAQQRQGNTTAWQLEARFEPLGYFSKNAPFVKSFIDAVFALDHAPMISPVFESSFGYHIVYLNEILPPFYTPADVVDREIRTKIVDEVRKIEINAFIEKLIRTYHPQITISP